MKLKRTDNRKLVEALHTICFPNDDVDLDGQLWVAHAVDGTPVGFCSARKLKNESAVFLSRAGVLPCANGKGLQRRMIHARVKWAREIGVECAITYVAPKNYPSLVNLLRCGFRFYHHSWAGDEMHYLRRDF